MAATERVLSPVAQEIAAEISSLLQAGRVLTTRDLDAIGASRNLGTRYIIGHMSRFGTILPADEHRWPRYLIGGREVIVRRYKGRRLLLDPSLPIEETDWQQVTSTIRQATKASGIMAAHTRQRFA